MKEGSIRGESMRLADSIVGKAKSMTEALNVAKNMKGLDPEVKDATRARIKQNFADNEEAFRVDREQMNREYSARIVKEGIDAIPPTAMSILTEREKSKLKTIADNARYGINPPDNSPRYYELMVMASTPELREKFLKTDLTFDKADLSEGQWNEVFKIQNALRNKTSDDKLDGFRTQLSVVNDNLAAVGIDPTPKPGETAAEKVNEFRARVQKEVVEKESATQKKLSAEEVDKISKRLLTKLGPGGSFLDPWGWFTSPKRAFEVPEEPQITIKDVPLEHRSMIEDSLRRNGRPVNDKSILGLYMKMQATSGK
jgi:hypothetical protein